MPHRREDRGVNCACDQRERLGCGLILGKVRMSGRSLGLTGVGFFLGLIAIGCSGGGDGPPARVEISGMTPQAGAAVAAKAVCTHMAQCGSYAITCMSGGAAGGSGSGGPAPSTTCKAVFKPGDFNNCYDGAAGDIEQLLGCSAITAADVDTLETCFDALDAQKCETQAEADARAQAAVTGNSTPQPEVPAACALLMNPPAACGSPPKR
jgi:hypothetical protein